jgi:hypothetical protein
VESNILLFGVAMSRTVFALSLLLMILVSAVAAAGVTVASAASPVWVEVAKSSGGIVKGDAPENGTDSFTVSHLEWRVRWSVVPLDSGLPVVDGSDFRFVVRPEYAMFAQVGEVSGKVFSETESGTLVIQNSYNRTYTIEADVSGYTSFELIVEENVNSPLLDIVPPVISILSPENRTYGFGNITVVFTVNKPPSGLWYKLDSQKVGMSLNASSKGLPETHELTLTGVSEGSHNITIYARDEAGNTQISETVYFSVESAPVTLIVVAVAVTAFLDLGLVFYYFKRRSSKRADVSQ